MKLISILPFLFIFFQPSANATKILYFGDSHSVATVGPFGIRMNHLLRNLPSVQVETHARCGSVMDWWYSGKSTSCGYFDQSPVGQPLPPIPAPNENWAVNAPTPKIIPIIENFKPNLIIVEMGGNYMHADHPLEQAKKEISIFISDLNKIKISSLSEINCVWIGPPSRRDHMEDMPPLINVIRESVEPTCIFIDSTTMTHFPQSAADGGPLHGGKDGIHYSFKEGIPIANAWAEKAFITVKTHYDSLNK